MNNDKCFCRVETKDENGNIIRVAVKDAVARELIEVLKTYVDDNNSRLNEDIDEIRSNIDNNSERINNHQIFLNALSSGVNEIRVTVNNLLTRVTALEQNTGSVIPEGVFYIYIDQNIYDSLSAYDIEFYIWPESDNNNYVELSYTDFYKLSTGGYCYPVPYEDYFVSIGTYDDERDYKLTVYDPTYDTYVRTLPIEEEYTSDVYFNLEILERE